MPNDVQEEKDDTKQEHVTLKRIIREPFDKIQKKKQEQMQKEIALLGDRLGLLINELRHSHELNLQSYTRLQHSHDELQVDLHTYLSMASLGIDTRDIPLRRFIPVRVYLSESDEADSGTKALKAILDSLDLSVSDAFPAETGSFWQRLFAKTNEVVTQPEIAERFQKLERAIEIQGLHQPQSQVDKNEAEAISVIISALDKVSSAAIQVGSIVIIKLPDPDGNSCIQARALSQQELMHLEKNPHLLKEPNKILDQLAEFNLNPDDCFNGPKLASAIYKKDEAEATKDFSGALFRDYSQYL